MNAHDAVLDALIAVLKAAPAIAGGLVDEEVDFEVLPEDVKRAISLQRLASMPTRMAGIGGPVDWRSIVRVSSFVRGDDTKATGRASWGLNSQVYERIMADPSLGGVAFDIEPPQILTEMEQRDTRIGVCSGDYVVLHRTQARTLEI